MTKLSLLFRERQNLRYSRICRVSATIVG